MSRPQSAQRPDSHHSSHVSDASGAPMECICQICTCGKHHCPLGDKCKNNNANNVYPQVCFDPINSTYRNHYPGHNVTPGRNRRKNNEALHITCPADHFQSTYRTNYLQHKLGHRLPKYRYTDMDYYPPMIPFDANSTYRTEHYGRTPERRDQPKRPPLPAKSPFDSTSTQRADFLPPPTAAYSPRRNNSLGDSMTRFPFDAKSTYGNDFNPPSNVSVPQRFPNRNPEGGADDRDFATTHKITYVPMGSGLCPASILPRDGRTTSKHTGHIHYHRSEVESVRALSAQRTKR